MNDTTDAAAAKASGQLAVILKAWLAQGQESIPTLMHDVDEHQLLLQSLALNVFYLQKTTNPQAIFDVLLRDDPVHQAQENVRAMAQAIHQDARVHVSEAQRAREFLRDNLAGGPVSIADLKQINKDSDFPLTWKAVDNAAAALKVVRQGYPGDKGSMWRLPASKSSSKSKPR